MKFNYIECFRFMRVKPAFFIQKEKTLIIIYMHFPNDILTSDCRCLEMFNVVFLLIMAPYFDHPLSTYQTVNSIS